MGLHHLIGKHSSDISTRFKSSLRLRWRNEPCDFDFADFNYFAAHYGTNDPLADLNGSGYVDWADYQIFSAGYGRTCL